LNILITGGAGGIGSTLALLLKNNGHIPIVVDNFNNGYMENLYENDELICEFYNTDVLDTDQINSILENRKIEVVIHLAAITSLPVCESNPKECIEVNVAGTASILDAVRRSKVKRVIVASTSAIYENNSKLDAPFEEFLEVSPTLFYPLSKKLMEDVIQSYIKNYDMDIVTLRFFNVFGPRQDIHRLSPPLINYIAKEIKSEREPIFYSNGKQVRDYIHVDDVVNLIELCLVKEEAKNEIFNVCTNTLTSVRDIISYAEKAFELEINPQFKESDKFWSNYPNLYEGNNPLKSEVLVKEVNKFSLGSYDKAEHLLGWEPNTDIESLMIDTMRKIKL
jgi:nucleoside-diphosphate-sugar epimerase